eukprot:11824850-Alexandrium_andersonii.AAC.1
MGWHDCSALAPLLGPGVETPVSQQGEHLYQSVEKRGDTGAKVPAPCPQTVGWVNCTVLERDEGVEHLRVQEEVDGGRASANAD